MPLQANSINTKILFVDLKFELHLNLNESEPMQKSKRLRGGVFWIGIKSEHFRDASVYSLLLVVTEKTLKPVLDS
jgi:hypothetical protein